MLSVLFLEPAIHALNVSTQRDRGLGAGQADGRAPL
jgi:hypothetical protein